MNEKLAARICRYLKRAVQLNYLGRLCSVVLILVFIVGLGIYAGGKWSFYNPPYGHPVTAFHSGQICLVLLLVYLWGWPQLRHAFTREEMARRLEKADPSLHESLSSALGFATPDPLMGRCLETSSGILPGFYRDTEERIKAKSRWRWIVPLYFWPSSALFLAFALFWSSMDRFEPFTAGDMWQLYRINFLANPYRPLHTLEVTPGTTDILKGESLKIQATLAGPGSHDGLIHYTMTGFPEETAEMKPRALGSNIFAFEFENLQSDMTYRVEAGPLTSPDYSVSVRVPPELTHIQLTYYFPKFMEKNIETVPAGQGAAQAPVGTTVEVSTRWNRPMGQVFLQVNDGDRVPFKNRGSYWKQSFVLESAGRYVLSGSSQEGVRVRSGLEFPINALEDLPPEIEWVWPTEDIDFSSGVPKSKIPLKYRVRDDHGLESVYLYAGAPGRATQSHEVTHLDGKVQEFEQIYRFDLNPWKREPVVRIYFVASDNHPDTQNQTPTGIRRFYIQPPGTFSESEDPNGPRVNVDPYEMTALELFHLIKLERAQIAGLNENTQIDQAGIALWSASQTTLIDKTAQTALRVSERVRQTRYAGAETEPSPERRVRPGADASQVGTPAPGGEGMADLPSRLESVVERLIGNTERWAELQAGTIPQGDTAIDYQIRQGDAGKNDRRLRSREEGDRALAQLETAFRELTGQEPPKPADEVMKEQEEEPEKEGEGGEEKKKPKKEEEGEQTEEAKKEGKEGEEKEAPEGKRELAFEASDERKEIVKTVQEGDSGAGVAGTGKGGGGGASLPTNTYAPSEYTLDPDTVHLDTPQSRLMIVELRKNLKGLDIRDYGFQAVPPEYEGVVEQYNQAMLGD